MSLESGLLLVIKQRLLLTKISKYLFTPCTKSRAKVCRTRGGDMGLLETSLLSGNEPFTRRHDLVPE